MAIFGVKRGLENSNFVSHESKIVLRLSSGESTILVSTCKMAGLLASESTILGSTNHVEAAQPLGEEMAISHYEILCIAQFSVANF